MTFSIRQIFLTVAFVAVFLGLVSFTIRVLQVPRNAYAVWWAADMVVEHLKANSDKWPTSWDELRKDSVIRCGIAVNMERHQGIYIIFFQCHPVLFQELIQGRVDFRQLAGIPFNAVESDFSPSENADSQKKHYDHYPEEPLAKTTGPFSFLVALRRFRVSEFDDVGSFKLRHVNLHV